MNKLENVVDYHTKKKKKEKKYRISIILFMLYKVILD